MTDTTRLPRIVIHLVAVSVLLLAAKPVLVAGAIAGIGIASLVGAIAAVESSLAPPLVGAGASLTAAAPFLRTLYRRVVAVESGVASEFDNAR